MQINPRKAPVKPPLHALAGLAATFLMQPVVLAAPPADAPVPAVPPAVSQTPPDDAADETAPMDPFATIKDLETRLEQTRSLVVGRQPRVVVGGYIDLGFFVPQGDGSGLVRDGGNLVFPQYSGYGWVMMGDILSPAVNSRG